MASTEFLVLRPIGGITTAELWAVCSQEEFWEELVGKATGTSNSHQRVRPADLLATEVADPRLLQASARKQINGLCRCATQARLEARTLAEVRDALLPGLMSGEIRVREAEEIVAEVT